LNISGLTNLLLELAGQAGSKVTPAARVEGAGRVHGAAELVKKAGMPAVEQEAPGTSPSSQPEAPSTHEFPPFVPLPLRSELYPSARFFARFPEEKRTGGAAAQKAPAVFICLLTENLGTLWFGLALRENNLTVKCFTESEEVNRTVRENLPLLKEELLLAGFSAVSLASYRRSELGSLAAEILPKFEKHLLDRRI